MPSSRDGHEVLANGHVSPAVPRDVACGRLAALIFGTFAARLPAAVTCVDAFCRERYNAALGSVWRFQRAPPERLIALAGKCLVALQSWHSFTSLPAFIV